MRKITIVEGHPDPSPERLNHALAEAYAKGAIDAGAEVRRISVGALDVPFVRTAQEFYHGAPSEAIASAQRDLVWADHIVLLYPLWMGDMPAMCKAFLEQAFRPDVLSKGGSVASFQFLRGKSFRFVVTSGMPAFVYRSFYGAHSLKSYERMLSGFGASPIDDVVIGNVEGAEPKALARQLARMTTLGAADSEPRSAKIDLGARLLYAASDLWMRLSKHQTLEKGSDDLLIDFVMPNYDVEEANGIDVAAPADFVFDAIQESNITASPLVRALFKIREAMMRGKSASVTLPGTFASQMTSLGWSVISRNANREIVLGTVSKPWKADPAFAPVEASAFTAFNEPGYAKIAFSIACTPQNQSSCRVRIHTRVQTTDAASRARFRRYWMLVFPGIELIRFALLHQIKHEAEEKFAQLVTV